MFNLMPDGLKIKQLIVDVNRVHVTDEDVKVLKENGLRLVSRPDSALPQSQALKANEAA